MLLNELNSSEALIKRMKDSGALKTGSVINAFKTIDRKNFVPVGLHANTYTDRPLSIGFSQTISQPSTVAIMLELLEVEINQQILDVGCGSGWTTALLGSIVGKNGKVTGLERIDELVVFGQQNISKYKNLPISIRKAGKKLGMTGKLFDRILVSAAADSLSDDLINQLKVEGILVMPIKNSLIKAVKKPDNSVVISELRGFIFVPLIT